MPRAPFWSRIANSDEDAARALRAGLEEWAWLAEGEGAPAPSPLAAAILGRAWAACRESGVYVESAGACARRLGADRTAVVRARASLIRRGLLAPCGIRLEDGRAVADAGGDGRVNNQCGYTVDEKALKAWRRALKRRAAEQAREESQAPSDGACDRTTTQDARTASKLGVRDFSDPHKISSKEKEEEKETARAGFDELAGAWAGARRDAAREERAYAAMLAVGYRHETIVRAAGNFASWIGRYHGGVSHMTLEHFLTADSQRKWFSVAARQLSKAARRAARKASTGGARGPQGAGGAAAGPAYTLADLEFTWLGPGQFLGRTPGGYEAMVYPAGRGASAMDGDLTGEELAAAWARQYGESGRWSRAGAGSKQRRAA